MYKCDRCQAEFRDPGPGLTNMTWPRPIKVEIPLTSSGMSFTRSTDLCWPCREHLMNTVKKALEP